MSRTVDRPKTFEEPRARKAALAELAELDVMGRRAEVGPVEKMEAVVTMGVKQMQASVRHLPNKHAPNLVDLRSVTAAKNALRGFITEVFDAFHRMGAEDEAA